MSLKLSSWGCQACSGWNTACFPFLLSPLPQRKPAVKVIPLSVLAKLQILAAGPDTPYSSTCLPPLPLRLVTIIYDSLLYNLSFSFVAIMYLINEGLRSCLGRQPFQLSSPAPSLLELTCLCLILLPCAVRKAA